MSRKKTIQEKVQTRIENKIANKMANALIGNKSKKDKKSSFLEMLLMMQLFNKKEEK